MEKLFKNKKTAIFLTVFVMFLWGSAVPMIKTSYDWLAISAEDTGSKILLAAIRFFIAGFLSLGLGRILASKPASKSKLNRGENKKAEMGKEIGLKKNKWPYIFLLALVQTGIQYIFYYIGLSNTRGVSASVIQAANAFMVVILSSIFIAAEYIDKTRIIALLLGTGGVVISSLQSGQDLAFKLSGEGFILIATLFNATSSVIVRKWGQDRDPFFDNGMQFIIGSLIMLLVTIFIKPISLSWNLPSLLLLSYGAFVSAASYSIWMGVLANQEAGEFGIYKILIPIFGSILSVIFLGEAMTLNLIVGLGLVVAGVFVLNKD